MDPNHRDTSMDLNMRLFKLNGLFQMITNQSPSLTQSKFYVMQLLLLLVFYAILLWERIYDYCMNVNDLGSIIYKSTIVVSCTEACVKSLLVYRNREIIQGLISVFHKDFLRCHAFNKEKATQAMTTSTNRINYAIKYCEWIITSTMAVWVLYPLVPFFFSGNKTLSVLDTWFPFDQTSSPTRECIYIIESLITLYTGYNLTIINGYFLTMVAAVSTQIDVLKSTLIDLKSISRTFIDDTSIIDRKSMNLKSKKDRINDAVEHLFNICILDHQKILRVCCTLEKLLNPIALLQVLASTVSLCFIPIMIVQPFSNTNSNAMSQTVLNCKLALYLACVVSELAIYCVCGHIICEQTASIQEHFYSIDWTDCTKNFRRSLLVAITRSKKPVTLTAGKLYPVDLVMFTSIMKTSYSCFTMLHGFVSRRN